MKKLDLHLSFLTIFILGLFSASSLTAQNAKIQWINNSSAIDSDTLDVYIDGTKAADNLLFRSATSLLDITSGNHTVNINAASSIDSGDQVISRFNITIQASSNNTTMIMGVDSPASFAANPAGRFTDIRLVNRKGVLLSTSSAATSAISFYNGVTDNAGINITARPTNAAISISKFKYSDTTTNLLPASVETFIDIKDTTGNTILKSYVLPLQLYGKKSLSVFTSGFMNPSANENGAAFGVFFTDTLGGPATALKEASRCQLVNNAPDVILESVDVWFNATKVATDLAFRKATTTFTVLSGTYDITVTKKNSPDTSASNRVLSIPAFTFQNAKNYLGVLTGVVDTAAYKMNPDGLNRSLALNLANNYAESNSNAAQTSVYFMQGIPDAGALSIDRNPAAPINVFGNTSYTGTAGPVSISSSGNQILQEKSNGVVSKSFRLTLTGQGGKAGVLMTSGFLDSTGNKSGSGAKLQGCYLALSDGTVLTLASLSSKIQVVHASADATIKSVKLFINGVSLKDTFNFRTATPFITLTAYKPYRFHIAPLGAADTTTAIYNFNLLPDSGKFYYAVAAGLVNTSGYAVNPESVDRSFTVILNANAKDKAAFNSKNVDLMYFHSISDAPSTTSIGVGQVQYLSKNDPYKSFHGYGTQSAFDAIFFDVLNASTDSLLFTCMANLGAHKGQAGLVTATGFLDPAQNHNGDTAMLFVSWPDGKTDSVPSPYAGVKSAFFNENNITFYPVPANDNLTIQMNMNMTTVVSTELIDLTGKQLSTSSHNLNKGFAEIKMNTATLKSGLYFVRLTSGEQTYTRKINIIR